MERYESAEKDFNDQFKCMRSSFVMVLIFVNIIMFIMSFISDIWIITISSATSSFFIYLFTINTFEITRKYFISKYK